MTDKRRFQLMGLGVMIGSWLGSVMAPQPALAVCSVGVGLGLILVAGQMK